MIERLEISGAHMTVDQKLHTYITKKIGELDRYLPRAARESAHAEVRMKEEKSSDHRQFSCEVTLHVPDEVLNVSDTTLNAYSAIDIVEAKLKHAIAKYKETRSQEARTGKTARRHLLKRRRSAGPVTDNAQDAAAPDTTAS